MRISNSFSFKRKKNAFTNTLTKVFFAATVKKYKDMEQNLVKIKILIRKMVCDLNKPIDDFKTSN